MLWSQICAFIPNIHHSFWGGINMNGDNDWLVVEYSVALPLDESIIDGMASMKFYE